MTVNGPQDWFQQDENREKAFKRAKEEAETFFIGKRCVITGEENMDMCDWHHLDENRDNNPLKGNLVPLKTDLHMGGLHRSKRSHGYSSKLKYSTFEDAALVFWSKGDFPLCYGANRLGSFIAITHGNNPNNALHFATEALHALRPLWELPLAYDTVNRNILHIITHNTLFSKLSAFILAQLSKEIASWFQCCRNHKEFFKWKSLGDILNSTVDFTVQDVPTLSARLIQHEGIIDFQKGDMDAAQKKISYANDQMVDLRYKHGIPINYQFLLRIALNANKRGITNTAGRLLSRIERDFGEIKPNKAWFPGQTRLEFWTGVGLLIIKAEIEYRKNNIDYAMELIHSFYVLNEWHNIQVIEPCMHFGVIQEYLSRYGQNQNVKDALRLFMHRCIMHPALYSAFQEVFVCIQVYLHKKGF